jgi:hypothetical protein
MSCNAKELVRRRKWITVSESLNIVRTGSYESRVKGRLVTVPPEADRQREEWNLSNEAQRSLRKAAGLNISEPICSIVICTSSNGVKEHVEPVSTRRRQHQASTNPARMHECSGVTGLACGEGYSREDGRDCIDPVRLTMHMELIKRPDLDSIHMHGSMEVRMPISGSETASEVMQPVRRVHSSDEFSAMEMDAKGPDFCKCFPGSPGLSELPEREREGIAHEE